MKSSGPGSKGFKRAGLALPALALLFVAVCGCVYFARARATARQVLLRNGDGTESVMDLRRLGELRLTDARTGAPAPFACRARRCLLVFFSPVDCSSSVGEIGRWQELAGGFGPGQLQVTGFLVRTSWAETQAFVRDYRPSFELSFDAGNQIEELIGLPQHTPFKVLTDGGGRVLLIDGPNPGANAQASFLRSVAEHVGAPRAAQ